MLKALIFDVDGTLADTESAHRAAFNATFAEVGIGWHWDESLYAALLDVAGGKERIGHYWRIVDPAEARGRQVDATIERIHAIKTRRYAEALERGALALRPGVARLLHEARHAGLALAIATTTTPANVAALLAPALGADWRALFASVCDGATVPLKKPAPDVYLAALRELGLAGADCVAFEDSDNGLRAATAAGIATVVTPTAFTRGQRFDGALRVLPHLGEAGLAPAAPDAGLVDLATLRRWRGDGARRAA